MPMYAPMAVRSYYETLINKVNSPSKVSVTFILPDPRNESLMHQIATFTEGRGAYFASLRASLETMKVCWQQASDKSRFSTCVFDGMLMFSAIVVDSRRASVSFQGQGWGIENRILLQLEGGPLLRQCVETCRLLRDSAVKLTSEAQYDDFIAAASNLS